MSLVSRAYSPLCLTYWRRYIPGWRWLMMKCGQRGGLTVRLVGFLCHPPPLSRGGPLFPPSLPVHVFPYARYTTRCGAPSALFLPLLALGRPLASALLPLLLPPLVRARCRALCLASPLPFFALVRRVRPLGPSVLPAPACCQAALPSYIYVCFRGGGGGQLGVFEELTRFLPKSARCAKISFHRGGGGMCIFSEKCLKRAFQ